MPVKTSARLAAAHVNDIHLAWRTASTTGDVKASYKGNENDRFLWNVMLFHEIFKI